MAGIDSLVNSRAGAFAGNPQLLMQRYQQSQDLLDLLALQKLKKEKEAAARNLQMAQGAPAATIKDQREAEVLDMTKQEIARQVSPGIAALGSRMAQEQFRQQAGIAGLPAPNMNALPQQMAQGGIVAFANGGEVEEEVEVDPNEIVGYDDEGNPITRAKYERMIAMGDIERAGLEPTEEDYARRAAYNRIGRNKAPSPATGYTGETPEEYVARTMGGGPTPNTTDVVTRTSEPDRDGVMALLGGAMENEGNVAAARRTRNEGGRGILDLLGGAAENEGRVAAAPREQGSTPTPRRGVLDLMGEVMLNEGAAARDPSTMAIDVGRAAKDFARGVAPEGFFSGIPSQEELWPTRMKIQEEGRSPNAYEVGSIIREGATSPFKALWGFLHPKEEHGYTTLGDVGTVVGDVGRGVIGLDPRGESAEEEPTPPTATADAPEGVQATPSAAPTAQQEAPDIVDTLTAEEVLEVPVEAIKQATPEQQSAYANRIDELKREQQDKLDILIEFLLGAGASGGTNVGATLMGGGRALQNRERRIKQEIAATEDKIEALRLKEMELGLEGRKVVAMEGELDLGRDKFEFEKQQVAAAAAQELGLSQAEVLEYIADWEAINRDAVLSQLEEAYAAKYGKRSVKTPEGQADIQAQYARLLAQVASTAGGASRFGAAASRGTIPGLTPAEYEEAQSLVNKYR